MRPVKVDPVGFKPLETRLDGRNHRLAAVAGDENASFGISPKTELRRQHEVVPASGKEVAQNLLGLPELIAVGRVDEVPAGVGVGGENAPRFVGLGAVSTSGPEIASAEHEFGDPESRVLSKQRVTHVVSVSRSW
jgi:hypothetical protein